MKTDIKNLPAEVSDEIDELVDELVEHAGEPDPLEEVLQTVLIQVYKGRLLQFASDLNKVLNTFACQCDELITCDCLRNQARHWAVRKLLLKSMVTEPDEEEVF
ncbi:hypothetical protein GW937_01095 [Candidatus Kaiserbacteria bacterium]|nr:hypothetical protein [Candidatus Kaiserbacteria bacterium]NCT01954.1 hypothetical protein [Candidatus Parcubacteria bacterium]